MRAAIYARRSKDEKDADSVQIQIDGARRFAAARGWTVDETQIFVDEGISRAEFVKRPAMLRMLRAAEAKAYDVLICRDETRLGGDMLRSGLLIADLIDAGVKLYFYFTGELVKVDGAVAKFVMAARGFSSEMEREKISQRTRENLESKARRGLVAGGVVYGYDNGGPKGARTRSVNEAQAAIVREIFDRYARGEGLRAVAKALNARAVPPPRGGSWTPSCIREMLRRPLYVGRIEWGKAHKLYRGGTRVRTEDHECELVTVDAPHLRIVSAEAWQAVRVKTEPRPATPKGGRPATYLLSGVLRCGACGGPMAVINGKDSYDPVHVYTCTRRRDRGGTVCASRGRRRVEDVDAAVLGWVRDNVLVEDLVAGVLAEVRRRLEARTESRSGEVKRLEAEVKKLRSEVEKFAELALEAPSEARAVFFGKIAERTRSLDAAEARLGAVRVLPGVVDLEVRRMERDALGRLRELRGLVGRGSTPAVRSFVRALFPDGIRGTPIDGTLRIEGLAAPEGVLGNVASPAGFERLPMSLIA
jgi:DNA invertase Pin-like site-specific DNA recombinase